MKVTVIEYGGIERHINCKSFEARTNQVENWIRVKYQDGSTEIIRGVATIKAETEILQEVPSVPLALKEDNEKMADLLKKQLTIISVQEEEINNLKAVFDKIRAEIETKYGQCDICEYFEDYDYEENDISEYRPIGNIADILQIIDKYKTEVDSQESEE